MIRLIVADTSPLVYLVLIEHIDILPKLFENVIVPDMVHRELCHHSAPDPVRSWSATPPSWVDIEPAPDIPAEDTLRNWGRGTSSD